MGKASEFGARIRKLREQINAQVDALAPRLDDVEAAAPKVFARAEQVISENLENELQSLHDEMTELSNSLAAGPFVASADASPPQPQQDAPAMFVPQQDAPPPTTGDTVMFQGVPVPAPKTL